MYSFCVKTVVLVEEAWASLEDKAGASGIVFPPPVPLSPAEPEAVPSGGSITKRKQRGGKEK